MILNSPEGYGQIYRYQTTSEYILGTHCVMEQFLCKKCVQWLGVRSPVSSDQLRYRYQPESHFKLQSHKFLFVDNLSPGCQIIFGIWHRARQWYCRPQFKISKRCDCLTISYGQTEFYDALPTDILYLNILPALVYFFCVQWRFQPIKFKELFTISIPISRRNFTLNCINTFIL